MPLSEDALAQTHVLITTVRHSLHFTLRNHLLRFILSFSTATLSITPIAMLDLCGGSQALGSP